MATDVAARGLDVDSLTHVIHYSIPDDPEIFVHRSGRTGRAGKDGISIALVKPEETRKLKQIKAQTKIDLKEKEIPKGEDIIRAQVNGVLENLFTEHEDYSEFGNYELPDLSGFSKEQIVHQMLQFKLRDLALYYRDRNDMKTQNLSDESEMPRSRRERRKEEKNKRGNKGGKRRNSENMVRFFFNLGKRDHLKKVDMLDIINKATAKTKKRADIGDIEILDKFTFFEVDKNFKNEILSNLPYMKFKGKEMRAEVAN